MLVYLVLAGHGDRRRGRTTWAWLGTIAMAVGITCDHVVSDTSRPLSRRRRIMWMPYCSRAL